MRYWVLALLLIVLFVYLILVPDIAPMPERLTAQLLACGSLCTYGEFADPEAEPTVDFLRKWAIRREVSCPKLFAGDEVFEASEWPPPKEIPREMLAEFTLGGRVPVIPFYNAARYQGGEAQTPKWTKADIERMKAELLVGTLEGSYGAETTNSLYGVLQQGSSYLVGKRVLVLGSERPWVEVLALVVGASQVTTVEYGKIISEVPEIRTYTPREFGEQSDYDAAIIYSSVEHSGLGRYGDGLSPWGDVITMAKVSCWVKRGGAVFVGVPVRGPSVKTHQRDAVEFNSHRVYGPLRLPLLLTNWETVSVHHTPAHDVFLAINSR